MIDAGDAITQMATVINISQLEAREHGRHVIWTIYKQPPDFPDRYVARRFEIGKGSVIPTREILRPTDAGEDSLAMLRAAFRLAGLHPLQRALGAEPQIVETWM